MIDGSSTQNGLLGFLNIQNSEDEAGYIGSAMVTDVRGYPLEFRVLTPVKPTPLQKVLFGSTGIEMYVSVEMCGKALLKGVQRKPLLYVVSRKELSSLSQIANKPVIYIRRPSEQVAVKTQTDSRKKEEGRLDRAAGGFQPIVWEGDFDDQTSKSNALDLISESSNNFDLIEAFTRMKAAVDLLAKNDTRYR